MGSPDPVTRPGVRGTERRRRWYDGLEPVTAPLRCRGELHRVTWRAGRLWLHDHDLVAESVLVSLGGERCACLDLLELCRHDVAALGPFPLWTSDAEIGAVAAIETTGSSRRDLDRRHDLLRSLPTPFRRRLALGGFVAAARLGSVVEPWANPPFAWVFGRLLSDAAAVVSRVARPDLDHSRALEVRWVGTAADQHPRAVGRLGPRGGSLHLALSPLWVADVWAHDLAVDRGSLVLALTSGERYLAMRWSDPDGQGLSVAELVSQRRDDSAVVAEPFPAQVSGGAVPTHQQDRLVDRLA